MISSLIEHAATFHGDTEIVSRLPEGQVRRTTWRGVNEHAKQVANALAELGIEPGDRVATLAWNSDRHLALYFGVSGSGAVMHTVNPRLFTDQIVYIVNHAADRVLFFDITFAPLVAQLADELGTVEHFVAMTDRDHMHQVAGIPAGRLLCWDDLIGRQSTHHDWPEFDERSASSLCYTSGTTGNPKGVLYSHRSTMLHTLMNAGRDTNDIHSGSRILLVVPMFHANAWGTPYTAAMVGATLVMPGPHLDGESVYSLMKAERVNQSQGVPTVWMMLFSYLDDHPEIDAHELGLRTAGTGGAALPLSMIERFDRDFGAEAIQGWGMTETSPLCVIGRPLPKHVGLDFDELAQIRLKQGRGIWGWSSRSWTRTVTDCPGTERLSVRSGYAGRGSPAAIIRARVATNWTPRVSSRPAMSRRSTLTDTCSWSTVPRMSSSPAVNGSAPSIWRTPPSGIPPSPRLP